MKPLSWKSKLHYNFKDAHPKKGYINWWDHLSHSWSKTANRMKTKLQLRNFKGD